MPIFAAVKRLLPFFLALLCVACHDELNYPESGTRRVVIVYMIGENSLSSNAQSDLNEIRAGYTQIPDDGKVVVYFDNSRTDVKPQIIAFDNQLGEQVEFEYGTDVVSTDSLTMQNTLRYIVDANPADEYALILWSHGSGWIPANRVAQQRTIGVDNGSNSTSSNSGTEMDIRTLRGVLEEVGVHWQYVMYDACFMQCIEVAYELREVTDWSIGSPAEIPAPGADYTRLMPYFFSEETFAADITQQYFSLYSGNYGLLISAIRSDQLSSLARATAKCLSQLSDFPTDGIQKYCAYTSSTGWKPEYFDMASAVNHWTGDGEAYQTWEEALDAAIPYRYATNTWLTAYNAVNPTVTDPDHCASASMYVPVQGRDADNAAWRQYDWYRDAGYTLDN